MARNSFRLGLITGLFTLLSCTTALLITDIFTVQDGAQDGGCDSYIDVLDQWLSESTASLDATLVGMDTYEQDIRVRRAMSTFFGIANSNRLGAYTSNRRVAFNRVRDYIESVAYFLNNEQTDGTPLYDRTDYWLHCNSTFLSLHEPTSPALDFMANEIVDQNGNTITVAGVPKYQEKLAEDADNKPWWSGDFIDQNGYYFTEDGANFCYEPDLAITAAIQPLRRNANGEAEVAPEIASMILCPFSFDNDKHPNSYREANNVLADGVSLEKAVPKSVTLVHETFHMLHGIEFLAGGDEEYGIGGCLDFGNRDPADAQSNPENYVFFIAHMYHMFGDPDGNQPWSIPNNWDFQISRTTPRVYGAFRNPL